MLAELKPTYKYCIETPGMIISLSHLPEVSLIHTNFYLLKLPLYTNSVICMLYKVQILARKTGSWSVCWNISVMLTQRQDFTLRERAMMAVRFQKDRVFIWVIIFLFLSLFLCYAFTKSTVIQSITVLTGWGSMRKSVKCLFLFAS